MQHIKKALRWYFLKIQAFYSTASHKIYSPTIGIGLIVLPLTPIILLANLIVDGFSYFYKLLANWLNK